MATTPKKKPVSKHPGLQSGRDGSQAYPGYLDGKRPVDKIMSESRKRLSSDGPTTGKETKVRSGVNSSRTFIEPKKQEDGSSRYFKNGNTKGRELKELKKQKAKRKK